MKLLNLILSFALCFPPTFFQEVGGKTVIGGKAIIGGRNNTTGNTFTFVSVTGGGGTLFCSGSTSCTLAVPSASAGHVLAVLGSSESSANTITAAVLGGTDTFTIPAGCTQTTGSSAVSAGYFLSNTSTSTSLVLTLATTTATRVFYWIYSVSPGPAVFDVCGTAITTGSGGLQAGVGLTLTGTNDVIMQWCAIDPHPTAISSPYGNFQNAGNPATTADLENTASGATPNWTTTNTGSAPVGALSLK